MNYQLNIYQFITGLDNIFERKIVNIFLPISFNMLCFFFFFDLILYVPSTIFQLNRDGSSWVEPVLS